MLLDILYRFKILKKKTILYKIKKIRKKKKMNLYTSKFRSTRINILDTTIDKDIELIKDILRQNISKEEVYVPNINSKQYKILDISSWYTNSKELIEGIGTFILWLDTIEPLFKWYEEDSDVAIRDYNIRRLKPYIKHIETIVNETYSIIYEKKRK